MAYTHPRGKIVKSYPGKIALLVLAVFALASKTHADSYSGGLKKAPKATTRIDITCFDDGRGPPASIYFDVQARTRGAAFLVMATITNAGVSESVIDNSNTDKKSSPAKVFTAGIAPNRGTYTLTLSKVKKNPKQPDRKLSGAMAFSGTAHCYSTTGDHTGTNIRRRF